MKRRIRFDRFAHGGNEGNDVVCNSGRCSSRENCLMYIF